MIPVPPRLFTNPMSAQPQASQRDDHDLIQLGGETAV